MSLNDKRPQRMLFCELTYAEQHDRGIEHANMLQTYVDLEKEAKESASNFKTKLSGVRTSMEKLATTIREGKELRPVEVRANYIHNEGRIEIVRVDTFEVVESRDMTSEERQMVLPGLRPDELQKMYETPDEKSNIKELKKSKKKIEDNGSEISNPDQV